MLSFVLFLWFCSFSGVSLNFPSGSQGQVDDCPPNVRHHLLSANKVWSHLLYHHFILFVDTYTKNIDSSVSSSKTDQTTHSSFKTMSTTDVGVQHCLPPSYVPYVISNASNTELNEGILGLKGERRRKTSYEFLTCVLRNIWRFAVVCEGGRLSTRCHLLLKATEQVSSHLLHSEFYLSNDSLFCPAELSISSTNTRTMTGKYSLFLFSSLSCCSFLLNPPAFYSHSPHTPQSPLLTFFSFSSHPH